MPAEASAELEEQLSEPRRFEAPNQRLRVQEAVQEEEAVAEDPALEKA